MATPCGGFSCCRTRALGTRASVVAALGAWSSRAQQLCGTQAVALVCGIFLDQGTLALAGRFLSTEPPGKSCTLFFFFFLREICFKDSSHTVLWSKIEALEIRLLEFESHFGCSVTLFKLLNLFLPVFSTVKYKD